MKSDIQIQKEIMDELKREPLLNSPEIGVSVKDGVVTLSGKVETYGDKRLAEKATRRIEGVKAVAEDIQVGISPVYLKTDTEIATAILDALKWQAAISNDRIKIQVEDGNVKLEGEVEWDFDRKNIQTIVQNLIGVRLVNNRITIKPLMKPSDVLEKITAALHMNTTIDSQNIRVKVVGSTVTLNGTVRSYTEKQDAEKAAWNAPGILSVENKLQVNMPEYDYEEG